MGWRGEPLTESEQFAWFGGPHGIYKCNEFQVISHFGTMQNLKIQYTHNWVEFLNFQMTFDRERWVCILKITHKLFARVSKFYEQIK